MGNCDLNFNIKIPLAFYNLEVLILKQDLKK